MKNTTMTKPATEIITLDEANQEIVTAADGAASSKRLMDYALLLKPRVMSLVLFTGFAGLLLAPGSLDVATTLIAVIAIAVGAGASGAINMWYDRDIDGKMERTMDRPLPAGRLQPVQALWLGTILSFLSVGVMAVWVNVMAAVLLAITITFYVFIYTIWLKRRTPQNIVIGGASGALPPMIGWAAVTGDISIEPLILFTIIFLWTPPHFWALALYRSGDYERAGVPMLPVVSGEGSTKTQILAYALILAPVVVAPAFVGMTSIAGGAVLALLSLWFIYHAVRVYRSTDFDTPRRMFRISILHLFFIFLTLLADHFLAPIFA